MKIITTQDINSNVKMCELIDVAQRAYEMLHDGSAIMPVRTISDLGESNPIVFYKPTCDNVNKNVVVKLLSQLRQTSDKGYPTIQGVVVLIDGEKNKLLAMVDGAVVTAMRTGAASGLATKLLSRANSEVLAVFGAGAQAYTQIEAVMAVRQIKRVIIFDLHSEPVEKLINHFNYLKDTEFVRGEVEVDLPKADIVCCVTNSKSPLFESSLLKDGVHINAIGSFSKEMRELPNDIFVESILYVDHKESSFSESGDIIEPLALGFINDKNFKGELVELALGSVNGRDDDTVRTIFKSVGVATQDLAFLQYVYTKSVNEDFGINIDM